MESDSADAESQERSSAVGGPQDSAVFLGWQKTSSGDEVPLYNVIVRDHPLFGSTVTDRTLLEHQLPVPATPLKYR